MKERGRQRQRERVTETERERVRQRERQRDRDKGVHGIGIGSIWTQSFVFFSNLEQKKLTWRGSVMVDSFSLI